MKTHPRNLAHVVTGFALALCAALAVAQTPPAHISVVKEGKTIKVSEHVYLIPDERMPMVPNVGIIVGTKGALVIDPGMGRRSGEVVLREVRKVSKGGELYIVNTHFHPEHTTGEMAFPTSAKIVRAQAQQQDVEEMGLKWVANFASRSPALADVLQGASFRAPTILFERERIIDLGGVRARVIRLGPGHTRGDTVVFVEGDGVLFSGDLAMKNLFPAFSTPQSRSDSWIESLDRLGALKARIVIGAHYDMTDASVIEAYRGYLKALQTRVAEMKKQGKTSDETAELLRTEFRNKYPDWQQPLRIHSAVTRIYAEQL